jgi:hypothetical protein
MWGRELEGIQAGLGHLHIIAPMAAADSNTTNNALLGLNREATTKDDQAISLDDTIQQGRIVLYELEPLVRSHTETDGSIRLILSNLHAQKRRPIHAAESFECATLVANTDAHGFSHLARLGFGSSDHVLSSLDGNAAFLEGFLCHTLLLCKVKYQWVDEQENPRMLDEARSSSIPYF